MYPTTEISAKYKSIQEGREMFFGKARTYSPSLRYLYRIKAFRRSLEYKCIYILKHLHLQIHAEPQTKNITIKPFRLLLKQPTIPIQVKNDFHAPLYVKNSYYSVVER